MQRRLPGSEAYRTIRRLVTDGAGEVHLSISSAAPGTYRLVSPTKPFSKVSAKTVVVVA